MRVTPDTICHCQHIAREHKRVDAGSHKRYGACEHTTILAAVLHVCVCEAFRPYPGQPKPIGSRKQPHGINRFPNRHVG